MKKIAIEDEIEQYLAGNPAVKEKLADLSKDELAEKVIGRIQAYELEKIRRNKLPDPIEEIQKIMRRRGLTKNDLKGCIGSSGNVCDILARRRPLSLKMIRNLHDFLGISAEVLIQPYEYAKR